MSVLNQDPFLLQHYQYCTFLGRIQSAHSGIFKTDTLGFRVSYHNNQQVELPFFNSVDSAKFLVLGNSVPYGVGVVDDMEVLHNICNNRYSRLCFNLSMRASSTFQDWILLGRTIRPTKHLSIFWVAGLNDLIATLLGDFSNPMFPPWFGEISVKQGSKWIVKDHLFDLDQKLLLLADSISSIIVNVSAIYNICFVWQPLHSRKSKSNGLSESERYFISRFYENNQGKLSQLYNSALLASTYDSLIDMVECKVNSYQALPGGGKIEFIDSSSLLPPDTLIDVTHLNSLGHSFFPIFLMRLLISQKLSTIGM